MELKTWTLGLKTSEEGIEDLVDIIDALERIEDLRDDIENLGD